VQVTVHYSFLCNLSQAHIKLEWIDGSNISSKRVRVTVTSPYTPFMPFLQSAHGGVVGCAGHNYYGYYFRVFEYSV
jgi:hypothetical protein